MNRCFVKCHIIMQLNSMAKEIPLNLQNGKRKKFKYQKHDMTRGENFGRNEFKASLMSVSHKYMHKHKPVSKWLIMMGREGMRCRFSGGQGVGLRVVHHCTVDGGTIVVWSPTIVVGCRFIVPQRFPRLDKLILD